MIKILDDKAEDPIKEWQWSSPINLEEMGANNVRNANTSQSNKFLYWKIDRRIQNEIIFITIEKEDERHPLYMIQNKSKHINLVYKQQKGEIMEFCYIDQSNRFAWDNFYHKHILDVEVFFTDSNTLLGNLNINIDEIGIHEEIHYKVKLEDGRAVKKALYYHTSTDGYSKKLIFDDKKREKQDKDNEDHTPELMMNLELGGIGISFI